MISIAYHIPNKSSLLQTASRFPDTFQIRHPESHKGTYGTLAVVGGSSGMSGAVVLASTAAAYQGCGKVWAGFNQTSLPFAVIPERPEIMLSVAENLLQRHDINAWVVGCGMGLNESAQILLASILHHAPEQPLLLDADALTLLAHNNALQTAARQRDCLVLTPHPAEAARLLGISTADIQANRIQAVQAISRQFQATTVLKGHLSLVSTPDGSIYTNTSGNAGLATAGSGDVLSGIIGSLLAQGIACRQAVEAGVWLHGAAADILRANQIGEIGMLAGEIAPAARWLRNQIIQERQRQTVRLIQA